MAHFYFFENDKRCNFVNKILQSQFYKYISDNESSVGSDVRYYINLEWNNVNGKGIDVSFLDKNKIRYVKSIGELPQGAGLYISAYDADQEEISKVKAMGIPLIEKVCPWILALKKQILKVSHTHQCIIMLDREHMVFNNYRSIFPENTIILNEENYKSQLKKVKEGLPVHFIVYSTFRHKDASEVIQYIEENYYSKDNIYWTKGICGWVSKSGIFEEIKNSIVNRSLDEVWIICSNENNRSVKSLIKEVRDNGAKARIIKDTDDVPLKLDKRLKIGVLIAPIPFSRENSIIKKIKEINNIE